MDPARPNRRAGSGHVTTEEDVTVTTDIAQARSAREALLRALGDDPRVHAVRIALFDSDGYHLKVRLLRNADADGIPHEIGGVAVHVVAA